VVVPDEVRRALVEHATAELPNEACGLVVVENGCAIRYEPGRNFAASPYRFELLPADPATVYLVDEGYEIGIFHSHVSAPARPSKTDVENIEGYEGWPYLIYSVRADDLAAFRISASGQVEELPIAD
jgi:proteasome lid subunit RPN8/RPN11